jgi:signal transduction histidine kinase
MLQYSQEEARRSVMDLRAQALESRDLAGALTDLVEQTARSTGVAARVTVEGTPRRLDAFAEHHLLRIGLEALTNALKHAGALRVDIMLRFDQDGVELMVRDDGCGLTLEPGDRRAGHFGLLGIRERVDKLGGVLHLKGAAGAGTVLSVRVPARQKPSDQAPATSGALGASWRTS